MFGLYILYSMRNSFFSPLFALLFCSLFLSNTVTGVAAELVMFEKRGCHWCKVWDEEVGEIYHKTPAGKIAPLRRVKLHDKLPEDLNHLKQLSFSPTFIVVHEGAEIGRIIGYPGEDFFWGQLELILKKVKML